MRIDHWIKNILVLPGIAVGLLMGGSWNLLLGIIGLLSICCIASANYVMNEWLDRKADRHHPEKNSRPAVKGHVTASGVWMLYTALVALGMILGSRINLQFTVTLSVFLFMGVIYNVPPWRVKDRAYWDISIESLNNPIRLLLGWYLVGSLNWPSESLLFAYWAAGVFLMSAKRLAEFRYIADKDRAGAYRTSFHVYSEKLLLSICIIATTAACSGIATFLWALQTRLLWLMPLIIVPFAWYLRITLKTNSTAQKPEELYKEGWFLAYLIGVGIIFTIILN